MTVRLKELLEERGLTAYEVARDSRGRLAECTLYRIVREPPKFISLGVLQALCDVLRVEPSALFSYQRRRVGA